MTKIPDDAISIREAAVMFGVTEACIRKWIKQSKIPAVRLGPKLIRVSASDIRKLIQPAYK